MRLVVIFILWFPGLASLAGEDLTSLPDRATNAPTGGEFVRRITSADFAGRERQIYAEITAGNIPDFLRQFQPVTVTNISSGRTNVATFFVTPDYLAIGPNEDYFLTPMTPMTARRIADRLDCTLPTRKMVDAIYAAAEVRLAPVPIPPDAAMTTVPVFAQHNATVRTQRADFLKPHPLGALVAGHQKDLVITPMLADAPGKVAIYGWHQTNGVPIQPLYLKHAATWVDYSQCVRLVRQAMTVNGQPTTVAQVLADPRLAALLSDEGVITSPRYPTNALPPDAGEFKPTGQFGELICSFTFAPEVKILINSPALTNFTPDKPVLLVLYTLPNGNTTGQTIGRKPQPGDDWHFDIQHIGAQTRFLRELITNRTVVVAYLETEMKSWPAWRKKYGDALIPGIVEHVKNFFRTNNLEIALTSHSGGGSFIFGYLNAVGKIPDDVVRIAFLDSNYGYDSALAHDETLIRWLMPSDQHFLCVLAYDDAAALLNGKPFVSTNGGTWGRSHAMLKDFSGEFKFTSRTNDGLETYSTLDGRIEFLLKENPEHKIFHTIQVERNGFIQAMLSGTTNEGRGYEYFGERVYTNYILGD
ncbi:MAG: hypothetical protein WDM80_12175 [Limisphaerales bacterium]